MAIWSDTRVIQTGTGTGNLSAVTGLTGQPQVLIFRAVRLTAAGTGAHAIWMEGVATSTTARWSLSWSYEDGSATTANVAQSDRTDACLIELVSTAAENGLLDVASFDANGYTLTVDTAFTADLPITVTAIGGLGDATCGTVTSNATGNQSFTPLSFQPDFLCASSFFKTAVTGFAAAANNWSHGWGTYNSSVAAMGCISGRHTGADNSGDMRSFIATDKFLAQQTANADTLSISWTLTSLDATGFTLNRSTGTGAIVIFYLAIKVGTGGAAQTWSNVAWNDTSNHDITTTGLNPAVLAVFGRPDVAASQTTPTANVELSWGLASSATARSAGWVGIRDNQTTHDGNMAFATDKVFLNYAINGLALSGDVDLNAFGTEKFTLDQVTADATTPLMAGWVIGNVPTSSDVLIQGLQAIDRGMLAQTAARMGGLLQ